MLDQTTVILALIGIITTAGAALGRWILARLNRLERQVSELQKENRDLVIERATQAAEIATLKSEIEQRDDARQERDKLREKLAERERQLRLILHTIRTCRTCWPNFDQLAARLKA